MKTIRIAGIVIFMILLNIAIISALTPENEAFLNDRYEKATIGIKNIEGFDVEDSATDIEKDLGKKFSEFTDEEKARVWEQHYIDLRGNIIKLRSNYFQRIVDIIDNEKKKIESIENAEEKKIAEEQWKRDWGRYKKIYNAAKEGARKTSSDVVKEITNFRDLDAKDGLVDGIRRGWFGRRINFRKPDLSVKDYESVRVVLEGELIIESDVPGWVQAPVNAFNRISPLKIPQNIIEWTKWTDLRYATREGYNALWGNRGWGGRTVVVIIILMALSLIHPGINKWMKNQLKIGPIPIGSILTIPADLILLPIKLKKALYILRMLSAPVDGFICLVAHDKKLVSWKDRDGFWDFTFGNLWRTVKAVWNAMSSIEHWKWTKVIKEKDLEQLRGEIAQLNNEINMLRRDVNNMGQQAENYKIKYLELLGKQFPGGVIPTEEKKPKEGLPGGEKGPEKG
ncbi:hypothetical protein KY345_00020 [Candidatus Woesearchaeota archaeon]|nr:hypothetical protein [Candidatus Woesearchaeota archaeon]